MCLCNLHGTNMNLSCLLVGIRNIMRCHMLKLITLNITIFARDTKQTVSGNQIFQASNGGMEAIGKLIKKGMRGYAKETLNLKTFLN